MSTRPRNLRLTIRAPGTLLSRVLDKEITEEQAALVALICDSTDGYVIVPREMFNARRAVGFQPPQEGGANARS